MQWPPDSRSARRALQKEWLACQWFKTIAHERGEIGLRLTGIQIIVLSKIIMEILTTKSSRT
jgi:hypothetical protein